MNRGILVKTQSLVLLEFLVLFIRGKEFMVFLRRTILWRDSNRILGYPSTVHDDAYVYHSNPPIWPDGDFDVFPS